MTIALVQSATAHVTSPSAAVATLGAAPTDGNLLLGIFGNATSANSNLPLPTGYTRAIVLNSGSGTGITVFFKFAVSDPTSLSITPSGGAVYDLHFAEFSGLAVPSLDRIGSANSGSTTTTAIAPGTSSLVGVGDLVVAASFQSASVSSSSHSAGWTSLGTTTRMLSAYIVDTDQSAKTDVIGWTPATKSCAAIASISPAPIVVGFTGWGQQL